MANKVAPPSGSGKSQDHTCSVMDSLPRATHPGNHKWTEPTGLKVVELGCVSLSIWAFVRSCRPLATEMSSICVCVQLENVLCVVGYRFSIMRSVGGKSTCSILVTYIDKLQTHLRRVQAYNVQLFPSCSPSPTFLIAAKNCCNYAPLLACRL